MGAAAGAAIAAGAATMIAPRGAVVEEVVEEEDRRRPWWPWIVAALFVIAAAIAGVIVWHQLSGGGRQVPVGSYAANCKLESQAVSQIEAVDLVPVVKHGTATRCQKDHVYDQDPAEGTTVAKGGNVTIWVSTGKPKVGIPPLAGKTWADASAALTGVGLKPVRHNVAGGKTKGIVKGTDPAAGQQIGKGSKVTVNVYTGPAIEAVPSVVNESLQQAQSDLTAAGFNLVIAGYVNSSQAQNTVVSQDPNAGTNLAQGSNVNVMLSKGPPMKTVKPVVGQTADKAQHDLEAAGFQVVINYVTVLDPTQDNIVQSQNPSGNTQAPQGSTVTINVGQYTAPTTTTATTTTNPQP
jgi:serine/threonine-protein kinase